jgi:hypothetical protein
VRGRAPLARRAAPRAPRTASADARDASSTQALAALVLALLPSAPASARSGPRCPAPLGSARAQLRQREPALWGPAEGPLDRRAALRCGGRRRGAALRGGGAEPGEAGGGSDEPSGPVVLPVPPPAELAAALEREEAAQEAQEAILRVREVDPATNATLRVTRRRSTWGEQRTSMCLDWLVLHAMPEAAEALWHEARLDGSGEPQAPPADGPPTRLDLPDVLARTRAAARARLKGALLSGNVTAARALLDGELGAGFLAGHLELLVKMLLQQCAPRPLCQRFDVRTKGSQRFDVRTKGFDTSPSLIERVESVPRRGAARER